MKVLPILVLLSSAAQLCSAAPDVEPLTCSEDNAAAAAHLAVHHINTHHDHGYKFRLSEIQGNKTEKVNEGCNIELQLDLLETKCHTVNPKPFEDCELRSEPSRAVIANCTVMISVKNSDAKVTEYDCDTRQVHTNREMGRMCPDCPILIALNSPEGLKAVDSVVKTFNKNTSNQHYYILQEVGRILTGYIPSSGMMYYPEVVLMETRCPMGSRIAIEACIPLCPDRAHHALCSASSNSEGVLGRMDCEFYPPKNTTALGPDEKEPVCKRHHHGGHFVSPGPPGPPGHADRRGPPPHVHGQDHADGEGHDHGRGHGKGHGHGHGHDSAERHGHGHGQGNGHGHGHGHGHADSHASAKQHGHDHGDGHDSAEQHARGHGHGPDQGHGHGHADSHASAKQHGHDHDHGHGHDSAEQHGHDHASGQGPSPHAPGPCHGVLTNVDPALHPICPWPHPDAPPNPRES